MTALVVALVCLAYAAPGVVVWRMAAGHLAWSFKWDHQDTPDSFDRSAGFLLGAVVGAVWPFAVGWVALGARVPAYGAERAAMLDAQEKRIAQLEQEAGIR